VPNKARLRLSDTRSNSASLFSLPSVSSATAPPKRPHSEKLKIDKPYSLGKSMSTYDVSYMNDYGYSRGGPPPTYVVRPENHKPQPGYDVGYDSNVPTYVIKKTPNVSAPIRRRVYPQTYSTMPQPYAPHMEYTNTSSCLQMANRPSFECKLFPKIDCSTREVKLNIPNPFAGCVDTCRNAVPRVSCPDFSSWCNEAPYHQYETYRVPPRMPQALPELETVCMECGHVLDSRPLPIGHLPPPSPYDPRQIRQVTTPEMYQSRIRQRVYQPRMKRQQHYC